MEGLERFCEGLDGGPARFLFGLGVGIGAVAVVIALMFIGPAFGMGAGADLQEILYTDALDGVESAQINLSGAEGGITVNANAQANDLITADLHYPAGSRPQRQLAGGARRGGR